MKLSKIKIFGLAVVCAGIPLLVYAADPKWGAILASVAHIVLAFLIYFWHGGNYFSPLSIFCFASGIFLGIPYFVFTGGFPWDRDLVFQVDLNAAALAAFISFIIVVSIVLWRDAFAGVKIEAAYARKISRVVPRMAEVAVSLTFIGFAIILEPGQLFTPFRDGFMFAGLAYFAVISAAGIVRKSYVQLAFGAIVCMTIFLLFDRYIFEGFGRLRVVTLLLCAAAIVSPVVGRRICKSAPFLLSPIGVYWASVVRADHGDFDPASLGSLFAPLETLGALITYCSRFNFGVFHGETYLFPFIFWVPRVWWENKPVALGASYVEFLQPFLAGTGHSLAASYVGEGVVNFGLIGVVFAAMLAGLIIKLISHWTLNVIHVNHSPRVGTIALMLLFVVSVSINDLVWADTNTFATRGITWSLAVILMYGFVPLGLALGRMKRPGAGFSNSGISGLLTGRPRDRRDEGDDQTEPKPRGGG